MTDYRKATTVAFPGTTVLAKTLVPGSGRGDLADASVPPIVAPPHLQPFMRRG
jgi:hypothetical protein